MGGLLYTFYELTPNVSLLKRHAIEVQREDPKTGLPIFVSVGPKTSEWTPLSKVSQFFLNAIVVAEDSRFYQHNGIDFREIWNSFLKNRETGRYTRGGSTITQQLVRLAFLTREKTLERKVREVLGALVLERILSKEKILEWYVNLIPLGYPNYGVQEASRFYFKTDAELLNIDQSILLAMIVPAPSVWSQELSRKHLSDQGKRRFINIARALFSESYITSTQYQKSLSSGNFGNPIVLQ